MLEALRKFFKTPAGMGVAALLVLIGLVTAFYSLKGAWNSEGANASADRMFIDAGSNPPKPFAHELSMGDVIPIRAPSGGNTGYPAEPCYWTKDGKIKTDPTWVLLNSYKGSNEPTFCPDCGRLVVGHNPRPESGSRPPPTKDEYGRSRPTPPSRR